jgi:segregation and condensation protein B
MNEQDLKYIVEATLLAAGRPVPMQQLLELFDERERPTPEVMRAAIDLLIADYEPRGIELVEVASGWRVQVRQRCIDVVSRLWQERASRYSRALLETLALIAYRQPITRSEIEEIRGVSISSTIMRTIQERNWIRVVGHREVPGHPELLGTTREFLDYFGLKSLDQLPTLAELRDLENIGVQLELSSGEVQGEAAADEEVIEGEAGADDPEAEAVSADNGDGSDDGELSAEAAQGDDLSDDGDEADDDEESTPTLVASAEEDSQGDSRRISEPPGEDR